MQAKHELDTLLEQESQLEALHFQDSCPGSCSDAIKNAAVPMAEPKDCRFEKHHMICSLDVFFSPLLLASIAEVECEHYVGPEHT
jgi:hypothetical protein